jgi:hypothetical protein
MTYLNCQTYLKNLTYLNYLAYLIEKDCPDPTDQTNMTYLSFKTFLNHMTYHRTSDVTLKKVFIF